MNQELYDETKMLVTVLKQKGLTIALAESCTGGFLSSCITNIEGASKVLKYGFVTYHRESKNELVGVSFDVIDRYGLVSQEVAEKMATGAQQRAKSDIAIGVTGNIGNTPNDDKEGCAVVWFSIALFDKVISKQVFYNDIQGDDEGCHSRRIQAKYRLAKEIFAQLNALLKKSD